MSELLTWGYDIKEIFKFIHPNFCQSPVVLVDDMTSATRESVWSCLPKNVTHVGASHNLQWASTLPNLEKKSNCCIAIIADNAVILSEKQLRLTQLRPNLQILHCSNNVRWTQNLEWVYLGLAKDSNLEEFDVFKYCSIGIVEDVIIFMCLY